LSTHLLVISQRHYKYVRSNYQEGKVIVHNRPHITCTDIKLPITHTLHTSLFQTSNLQKSQIERLKRTNIWAVEVKRTEAENNVRSFLTIAISATGDYVDRLAERDSHLHKSVQLYKAVVLNTFLLVRKFLNFCLSAHLRSALAVVT
jgi:glycerol-3-phosphate dehydrogenase